MSKRPRGYTCERDNFDDGYIDRWTSPDGRIVVEQRVWTRPNPDGGHWFVGKKAQAMVGGKVLPQVFESREEAIEAAEFVRGLPFLRH